MTSESFTTRHSSISGRVIDMIANLPVLGPSWVQYKGENVIAFVNYDASERASKPILSLYASNQDFLDDEIKELAPWNPNLFLPSPLEKNGYRKEWTNPEGLSGPTS